MFDNDSGIIKGFGCMWIAGLIASIATVGGVLAVIVYAIDKFAK
jgi:hypothetical protein